MSAISFMEWNSKTPLSWELEHMIMCNSKSDEASKTLQTNDWSIDTEELVDGMPLYTSRFGSGSSCFHSGIDLGYASLSKSSKSASMNSSSTTEMKICSLPMDAYEGSLHDLNKNNAVMGALNGTSPTFESSVCSGEPLLGLKLGKRIYFEDTYEGNDPKPLDVPFTAKSPGIPAKRLRSASQGTPGLCCQVLGCNLDLSSAKGYHRKHKVCESHSKCPKVIVNGIERRFCQQCSRFHGLSEFDEKKRSCRKRLSDHNARRRKPQSDLVQLDPTCMSTTLLYGGLRSVNPALGKVPLAPARSASVLTWAKSSSSGLMQRRENMLNLKHPMAASVDGEPHVLNDGICGAMKPLDVIPQGSSGLLSFKSADSATLGDGSGERMISFTLDDPRDVHRALSLLSTTDSHEHMRPKAAAHDHPSAVTNDIITTRIEPPRMSSICQIPVSASTGYWHVDQPGPSEANIVNPQNGVIGTGVPDIYLPDGRHDFGFDLYSAELKRSQYR